MTTATHDRLRDEIAQLRQSEARYRRIIEAANEGIWTIDADAITTYVNPRMASMLGFTPAEMVGRPVTDFVEPTLAAETAMRILTWRAAGADSCEQPLRRKDGSIVWTRVSATPETDPSGRYTGQTSFVTDVTELRREREALRESEERLRAVNRELLRSNTDLEQFAYVASHDLQEPLRMVSSYVQLLKEDYGGRLAPEADEFIGFAVDGAQRMQQLIHDLLAYSRVGTRAHGAEPTDTGRVLAQVRRTLQFAIEEAGATVTADDALPVVHADPTQFHQLLQNLVGNALKFRGSAPPRVRVSAARRAGEWEFRVADNGIGIDPRHAERVFGVFQRLHTRAEYPGTGIGLAICKKIVERHGGRIRVESALGAGATFCFTWPLAADAAQPLAADAAWPLAVAEETRP